MFVAKVTGAVVATQKVATMVGHKLLVVEPYRLDPQNRGTLITTGRTFVAVDTVGAGQGEFVLLTQGSSARLTPETKNLPIDTVIIGIVDMVHVDNQCVFEREKAKPTRSGIRQNSPANDQFANSARDQPKTDIPSMQATEELIRSVVEQVLSQLGPKVHATNGSSLTGRHGIFTNVDEAVAAATEAFEQLSERTIADRRRIIDHIRRISIDDSVELGTMEMEETKIGRLPHKIEKLKTLGERTPGVEFLKSEVFSGDHGLAVIEYAPFGVIGAITPVTHSLPTITGNADQHDRLGQYARGQSASERQAGRGRGRAAVQSSHLSRSGNRQPDLPHRRADDRIGRRDFQSSRSEADLRHRRPGRRPGGAEKLEAGDRRRAGQSAGGGRRDGRSRSRCPLHHPRRRLRQQFVVHLGKRSVCRRRSVRQDDGRDGSGRRGAAECERSRRSDASRDRQRRRRERQARRAGQGILGARCGGAGPRHRQADFAADGTCCSAKPTSTTRLSRSSR